MNIGDAAIASGVSSKMIRYYESISLIPRVGRTGAGYRVYTDREVFSLKFIRHARDLGFSVDQIAKLLALWQNRDRASAEVKKLALAHVEALEAKAEELHKLSQTLRHLAEHCNGNDRPDCPIIEELADGSNDVGAVSSPKFGVKRVHSGRQPSSSAATVPPRAERRSKMS